MALAPGSFVLIEEGVKMPACPASSAVPRSFLADSIAEYHHLYVISLPDRNICPGGSMSGWKPGMWCGISI